MKTPLRLLVLLLIVNFSSCSKEEVVELDEETSITNTENLSRALPPSETAMSSGISTNAMQWAAYLTAQVFMNSNEGRAQFLEEYNASGTGVVKLSDLLDDHVQDQSFKNAFRAQYSVYAYSELPYSCDQLNNVRTSDRPTPPTIPSGGDDENYFGEIYGEFLNAIVNNNCLEFYLPNGYNPLGRTIISSAHPLLDQNFNNEAYRHSSSCNISNVTINGLSKSNVIIVRPFRNAISVTSTCSYSEFDFNFTDFLN